MMARAASNRRALCMVSLMCGDYVDTGSLPSVLVTAASLDRASGRRTWAGSRHRSLRGAVRSARLRCGRSGTTRTRRRARTATPWHRRARCRPHPPTREQTWSGVATHRAASSSEPYVETASRRSCAWYSGERQPLLTTNSTPSSAASVAAWRRAPRSSWIEVGDTRNRVIKDRRAIGDDTVSLAKRTTVLGPRRVSMGVRASARPLPTRSLRPASHAQDAAGRCRLPPAARPRR